MKSLLWKPPLIALVVLVACAFDGLTVVGLSGRAGSTPTPPAASTSPDPRPG